MKQHISAAIVSALASTVLASGLLSGIAASAHASPGQGWVVEGEVVVSGDGGAHIQPYIWPNLEVPSNHEGVVPMLSLPATHIKSGTYRIEIAPSAVPEDYVNDWGEIALRLVISNGTIAEIQEVTVPRFEPTSERTGIAALASGAAVPEVVDFVNPRTAPQIEPDDPAPRVLFRSADLLPRVTKTSISKATSMKTLRVDAKSITEANEAPMATSGSCYVVDGSEHGPYMETFVNVYGTTNVKGKVDQFVGSSHQIGIAVKGTGAWGASGSTSLKVTAAGGYKTDFNVVDSAVANMVKQKYYYTKCETKPAVYETVATQSKPIRIESGPEFTRITHTNYANCSTGYVGVDYYREDGTNGTITGGMALPFVKVNAQAGWTKTTVLHYKFTKQGKICGSDMGWMAAKAVSTTA